MLVSERDRRIVANISLVRYVVHRLPKQIQKIVCAEYDDLFSVGCIGLIKAVDKFDESKGVKFSSFAVPHIRGEILKHLERKCYQGGVKIGRKQFRHGDRVWVQSLDAPLKKDGDTLLNILPAPTNDLQTDSESWMSWALGQLKPHHRLTVEMGLIEVSNKDIAEQLNVSPASVTRYRRRAIKQLQQLAESSSESN